MPNIIFKAVDVVTEDKLICPEPAKLHLPEWFRKLKLNINQNDQTIRACMPFQDSLMAGYVLKNPIDQEFNFLKENNQGIEDVWVRVPSHSFTKDKTFQNINEGNETHPIEQLGGKDGGCPFVKMNAEKAFYKILNPFTIILPKGYSCLLTPLLNRPDPRFTPLTGIVDEGNDLPPNFPIVMHKKGTWLLKKGEPVIGVIPFKREKWKMKIEIKTKDFHRRMNFSYGSKIIRWYRDLIWKRKQWD
jgi:hypothetical protein